MFGVFGKNCPNLGGEKLLHNGHLCLCRKFLWVRSHHLIPLGLHGIGVGGGGSLNDIRSGHGAVWALALLPVPYPVLSLLTLPERQIGMPEN